MYEEVCDGNDRLAEWLREPAVKSALLLAEEVQPDIVSHVVAEGYARDLTDHYVWTRWAMSETTFTVIVRNINYL